MFLIIGIQVRISIWCCLTLQAWVTGMGVGGGAGRVKKMPEANEFQGHRGHWGGGKTRRKQRGRTSHAVQEVSVYHPHPTQNSQKAVGGGRGWIDEMSRKA